MSTLEVNSIDKESGSTLTLGGSGTQVTVHASATTSGFDSGLASVQTFTSSGTWTRPTGITKVIMEVQGAGGGGGCDSTWTNIRGGCGGGYARKFLDVSSISTATITVGSGGAGITSGGTANAGGNSSWADGTNTITGNGGDGANPNSYVSGYRGRSGGTATGGDINIQGGNSQSVYTDAMGDWGTSVLGTAGMQCADSNQPSAAQLNGTGYGSGGGGRNGGTSGSGADGIVIVWEYK